MYKRCIIMALLTMALCTGLYGWKLHREQTQIAEQVLRLHIVANSDTASDQELKLAVRDALLPEIRRLTGACQTRSQAEKAVADAFSLLRQTAVQTLRDRGCADPVELTLGTEQFPGRDYETFSLPAGAYRTLRVTIGSGQGHNWWCVAFPALCDAAASELDQALEAVRLSGTERDLITGEDLTVELKFRSLELWNKLRQWLGR